MGENCQVYLNIIIKQIDSKLRSLGGFRTISECKEQAAKLDWKPLEDDNRKSSVECSDKFFNDNTADVCLNLKMGLSGRGTTSQFKNLTGHLRIFFKNLNRFARLTP